jgi:hypothetical protein
MARAVWEEARELFRGISHENGMRTLDARLAKPQDHAIAYNAARSAAAGGKA